MTAKEKAKELVDKMFHSDSNIGHRSNGYMMPKLAKQCALIAVNEIIELLKRDTSPHEPEYIEGERRGVKFWQQVIGEIKAVK